MLRSVLVGLCPARSAPAKRDIFDADLDRARRKPGCALCRLVRERDESAMRHMLWEDCTDPHIGAKISQHWGFCPYHIWSLIALEHEWMGDTLGVGVVYEALLRTLRTHLHEQEQKNRSLAQALPIGPQVGSEECLFCRHARQGESWFLTRLTLRFRQAARQDDTELWAALDTTLCLMHS